MRRRTAFKMETCMKLIAPRRVGTAVALACFALAGSAQADDTFKISGFGNFVLRDKRERQGRNPQTGDPIVIDARRVLAPPPAVQLPAGASIVADIVVRWMDYNDSAVQMLAGMIRSWQGQT